MLGTYRLVLAILVVLNHGGVRLLGLNPGEWAVIQFFLVSGYVMSALIHRHYAVPGRATLWFYADRALRIFPQYLLFLVLTLAWVWYDPGYLRAAPTEGVLLAHLVILPLNLVYFWDALHNAFLIPQAWSLALEEQFYLLYPWVVRRRNLLLGIFAASLALFVLGASGRLDRRAFTLNLLPGTMFIFVLGGMVRAHVTGALRTRTLAALYGAVALVALAIWDRGKFTAGANAEVLTGVLVGVPVLSVLARLPARGWDDVLGRASYGTFLGHMLVRAVAGKVVGGMDAPWFNALAVVLSVGVGMLGWWVVERPTQAFRHALRRRRGAESPLAAPGVSPVPAAVAETAEAR